MASVEQSVKSQFERVFKESDWYLFKKVAESNLKEAAKLKRKDMQIESRFKLLARNARKRLLIGVGVELLLKAIYLKQGYLINKPRHGSVLTFPFKATDLHNENLAADSTFQLNNLVQNLADVLPLSNKDMVLKGLCIAKVFRNKEGHSVTDTHQFDASNYIDIATSLSELYRNAFAEKLTVRFSMAPNERALWRVTPVRIGGACHRS
jgi:hypothetical protein